MTDRNDAHPADFDPVAAVFEEPTFLNNSDGSGWIVPISTYTKMQAVIEAARGAQGHLFFSDPFCDQAKKLDAALCDLDGA